MRKITSIFSYMNDTLRFHMNNDWVITDLSNLINTIKFLDHIFFAKQSDVSIFTEVYFSDVVMIPKNLSLSNLNQEYHYHGQATRIKAIQFASPGFIDIVGVDKLIEQIRLAFQFVMEYYRDRTRYKYKTERERIKNDAMELENIAMRLEITRDFIQVLKETGFPERLIQEIIQMNVKEFIGLEKIVQNGKLEKVEFFSEEDSSAKAN